MAASSATFLVYSQLLRGFSLPDLPQAVGPHQWPWVLTVRSRSLWAGSTELLTSPGQLRAPQALGPSFSQPPSAEGSSSFQSSLPEGT